MSPILPINSKNNPVFRNTVSFHDRKTAREQGVVFIEGIRLMQDALISGFKPHAVFMTEDKKALALDWAGRFSFSPDCRMYLFSEDLFRKLSQTQNPQGIAMLVTQPPLETTIPQRGEDIYLICEKISDPGNLGAMIRMADAFSFSAVILSRGTVDPFNEKTLRAAMGSCFHIPILMREDIRQIKKELEPLGISLVGTHLKGADMDGFSFSFPCAYVIGNEAAGLSEDAVLCCDRLVKIPMEGSAESLNAACAAAVIGYELSRLKRKV